MTYNPNFKDVPLLDAEYLRNNTREPRGYSRPLTESDEWPIELIHCQ